MHHIRTYSRKGQMIFLVMFLLVFSPRAEAQTSVNNPVKPVTHAKVFYEDGQYGGWPANWGMWNWGNEILVGFIKANHKDTVGHTFEVASARAMFSRSLDGGLTWQLEDAYEHGITEAAADNFIGSKSVQATALKSPIDFTRPDFAFTFRMLDMYVGPTSFYYTYDRGKKWNGAFKLNIDFPKRDHLAGVTSRTDYIIEGKHEMTAFLTVGFKNGEKNWREIACVRTDNGGITWKFLSWIGEHEINSIMPASIRLGPSKLITLIRRTKPPEMAAFLSEDNGLNWKKLKNPVVVDANGHPPALLKLRDGRLCLVYGIRNPKTMKDGRGMYVTYSKDEGKTWDEPALIRGKDGPVGDLGYPRSVELPDGRIVATYYYNNAEAGNKYRYIAATVFFPSK